MEKNKTNEFVDLSRQTKFVKIALYGMVLFYIISIISNLMESSLLQEMGNKYYSEAEAEANDRRQEIVGYLGLFAFIATGVLVMVWIYRANANARWLGATEMRFSPGWSIGWYFIPVANLWKPFQAMKEIWKASSSPLFWQNAKSSPLLAWWWGLWIAEGFVSQIGFQVFARASRISDYIAANAILTASDFIGVALSLVLIRIVSRIHEMQMRNKNDSQISQIFSDSDSAVSLKKE